MTYSKNRKNQSVSPKARRSLLKAVSLLALGAIAIPGGAGIAQAAGKSSGTILVLGDSLSAEYGIARGTGWVALLAQQLSRKASGYRIVNASISGETTAGGLRRIDELLGRHRPAIVIVELGGNDALRGLDLRSTENNLREIIRSAHTIGARVALLGMQVPPNYGKRYADWFAEMFGRLARAEGTALVPFLLDGVAQRPELFQADRIHPTAQAQPIMLDNVWPVLRELL